MPRPLLGRGCVPPAPGSDFHSLLECAAHFSLRLSSGDVVASTLSGFSRGGGAHASRFYPLTVEVKLTEGDLVIQQPHVLALFPGESSLSP